jgi:hypothetical protein
LNQPGGIAKAGPCEYPHTNKEKGVNGKNSKEIIIVKSDFYPTPGRILKKDLVNKINKKYCCLPSFL